MTMISLSVVGSCEDPSMGLLSLAGLLATLALELRIYVEHVDTEPELPLVMKVSTDCGQIEATFTKAEEIANDE